MFCQVILPLCAWQEEGACHSIFDKHTARTIYEGHCAICRNNAREKRHRGRLLSARCIQQQCCKLAGPSSKQRLHYYQLYIYTLSCSVIKHNMWTNCAVRVIIIPGTRYIIPHHITHLIVSYIAHYYEIAKLGAQRLSELIPTASPFSLCFVALEG